MKNELGRKLTSLTIMAIMVAGGLTFAAPGFLPETEAQSERLMYVSSESEEFGNTIGGGMITEIIIADPTRAATDQRQGEPTVEVNGDTIRMTQGADGYWYAYIADTTKLAALDTGAAVPHKGNLDYGTALAAGAGGLPAAGSGDTTSLVVTPDSDATIYHGSTIIKGEPTLSFFNLTDPTYTTVGGETAGAGFGAYWGQINVTDGTSGTNSYWPFIQAFDMSEGDQEIVFEKPGADEVVVLDFDTPGDFASFSVDRNAGPAGAEVHIEIRDNQLNMDPTAEESWMFDTDGTPGASYNATYYHYTDIANSTAGFDDNGILKIVLDAQSTGTAALAFDITADDTTASATTVIFTETASNSGVFTNADDADDANVIVSASALRGTTGTIDYNDSPQSYTVATYTGSIDMVESDAGEEWNSGEEITVRLTDGDLNLNTASSEDQYVKNSTKIPTIRIGSPLHITLITSNYGDTAGNGNFQNGTLTLDDTSKIATVTSNTTSKLYDRWTIKSGLTHTAVIGINTSVHDTRVVSWDFSSMCATPAGADRFDVAGLNNQAAKGAAVISAATFGDGLEDPTCEVKQIYYGEELPIALDYMAFGADHQDAIYRIEVEETDDNTGVFEGGVEYRMLNQLDVDHWGPTAGTQVDTFFNITTVGDSVDMILKADNTGTDAPRVKYADVDSDGQATGIADQVDAPTHSGTVDFDQDSYKRADTVTVTITDMDLNTDSELIDVYTTWDVSDKVGDNDNVGDHLLDIYIGDVLWDDSCNNNYGLYAQGFHMTETDVASGEFVGTFQIPEKYCSDSSTETQTTGKDFFVNYIDFRDAGGNTIEVGDAATVSANTGSVSLDKSVYPVPFKAQVYQAHDDIYMSEGNITVTIAVTDPDYDTSPTGEDTIAAGAVKVVGYRGSYSATLESSFVLTETEPSSGVFEYEFLIDADTDQINSADLKQGDVITVTYTDPSDATGVSYDATDSSTLDLRSGSLLSDKSVYVIGSDAIITLVEPDLNFDSGTVESYTLGLVEWDSDAGTVNLNDSCTTTCTFDPEPSKFRETGEDTGIFQTVIEIPTKLGTTNLDRGEKIDLEYVDYGPAGEDRTGDDTEDIELNIYTSNFGATIELDSKVYTWTDRIFITIVAPDHNTDSSLIDEIGGTTDKSLKAQTRDSKLTAYKLLENGPDTGIFIGEITLIGMTHDADGDGNNDAPTQTWVNKNGPTDGWLESTESDGVTVSFEYTEDATVVSSSLVRWNVGEVSFSEDSYLSSGSGIVTVVDPDMNLNPDTVENFDVTAYSDSDSGGIKLTVSETNESTGIFEGTVFFTTSDPSSGHTLRVSEGDSITAEYTDHTLPEPYSTADDIDVSTTAVIGTSIAPLDRAPVANARVVDAFGNSLAEVSVDQQVQIEADLVNGQDGDQSFAYLVQVQDSDGVTVSLAWITGQLAAGQSFSPALSWIPSASGSYEATVFVWESVDNPTALSDTATVSIQVV